MPPFTPEVTEGQGDLLVADQNAHLAFSIARTNALNHAQALWDPGLQDQVLRILNGEPSFWG